MDENVRSPISFGLIYSFVHMDRYWMLDEFMGGWIVPFQFEIEWMCVRDWGRVGSVGMDLEINHK